MVDADYLMQQLNVIEEDIEAEARGTTHFTNLKGRQRLNTIQQFQRSIIKSDSLQKKASVDHITEELS